MTIKRIEPAVLAYLTGTPLTHAAGTVGLTSEDLAGAATRYQEAGRAALDLAAQGWRQINVEFSDPAAADNVAVAHLIPALRAGQASGASGRWWFMRKRPGWRLRIQVTDPVPPTNDELSDALARAKAAGGIVRWWPSRYEPEVAAFGGPAGIHHAHDLFAEDSTGFARLLVSGSELDRVLLSLLLMTHLQRAAGLDWHERGDVWARVADQRNPAHLSVDDARRLAGQARTVITTDTHAISRPSGTLAPIAGWADRLNTSGRRLSGLAQEGALTRGLRDILALHVIYHWNRLGLSADQQAAWAGACRDAVLQDR